MTKNIEHTIWYRKWNTIFFTVCLILFSIPCIYFEMTGAMIAEGRVILYSLFLVILYGWVRSIVLLRKVLGNKALRVSYAIRSPREELIISE